MRKSRLLSCLAALALLAAGIAPGKAFAEEEAAFFKVPVGLSYASTYWWRGVELNGKGSGVLWPSAGLVLGDTGLSFLIAAGLNADYLYAGTGGDREATRPYHEFDYGASFAKDLGDIVSFNIGVLYVSYPFYDEADPAATNPSFIDGMLGLGLKTVLNPRVDFYYDYYVKENADKTPRDEDYYVKFSLAQEFAKTGDSAFTVSAWVGYYNNAYLDAKGWSDAGARLGFLKDFGGTVFAAGLYYARSLDSDFWQEYDPDEDGRGRMKNHVWADFSVSRTL